MRSWIFKSLIVGFGLIFFVGCNGDSSSTSIIMDNISQEVVEDNISDSNNISIVDNNSTIFDSNSEEFIEKNDISEEIVKSEDNTTSTIINDDINNKTNEIISSNQMPVSQNFNIFTFKNTTTNSNLLSFDGDDKFLIHTIESNTTNGIVNII